jgi:tetratricopeptide (TPR) repeat protein
MFRNRILILIAVVALLLAGTIVYIPDGTAAVRETAGGEVLRLEPGFHVRLPLYQRVYRYDSEPVVLEGPMPIVSRDQATFHLPMSLSVRVSGGDVLTFHAGRSGREPRLYLEERAREAILAAARTLNADELLTPEASRRLGPPVSSDLISRGIADDGLEVGRPEARVVFNAVVDYLRRDLAASARNLAERSLAERPGDGLCHAAMGAVLEAEGARPAAEQAFLEALMLDPAALEPMSRLFVMYQSTNDRDKIARLERLLTASLEKNRESAVHHDWLGQVYMRSGRPEKAEMSFTTAIGLAPKEAEFRISLGSLKAKLGKYAEARAAFEEALAIRPEHPLALYNIGVSHALEGDTGKALEYFLRAERVGPPNPVLLNALAQAYEDKGDLPRAAEYLRRSLQSRADQPDRARALRRIETRLRSRR